MFFFTLDARNRDEEGVEIGVVDWVELSGPGPISPKRECGTRGTGAVKRRISVLARFFLPPPSPDPVPFLVHLHPAVSIFDLLRHTFLL